MTARMASSHWLLAATLLTIGVPKVASSASTEEPSLGGLRRAPWWRFRLVPETDGAAVVRAIDEASPAARAGLREGDRVLRLGGVGLADARAIATARRAVRGGDEVELEVGRDAGPTPLRFRVEPLSLESIPGCDVEYGAVLSPRGHRVRTVITRPQATSGQLPAVLFIPWLSCDPVETPLGGDGWHRVLRDVAARSGYVTMRVEKPGVGDSEGTDCATNDLETDLDAFRAALAELRRRPDVDASRIVLFGGSIGGALAPVLAAEQPESTRIAGLVIAGTFSRTWYEHMLEFERARLELEGTSAQEIERAVRAFAEFYRLYFDERKTPAQVMEARPGLAWVWQEEPDGQYGRPAAYFHQVARLDVPGAWARLEVPTLVLYGEYDWIMSRDEHEHVVTIVNTRHPGRARLEVLPRTDHNFGVYASRTAAFRGEGGEYDPNAAKPLIRWLRERTP